MAIEVWIYPTMEYFLLKFKNDTKIYLDEYMIKCYDNVKLEEYMSLMKLKGKEIYMNNDSKDYDKYKDFVNNKPYRLSIFYYDKITYKCFVQDTEEVDDVREQSRILEEGDALLEKDSDDDSVDENHPINSTLYIPDASHTAAGGSREQPPVFNIGSMIRNLVTPSRRSTLTVNDEINVEIVRPAGNEEAVDDDNGGEAPTKKKTGGKGPKPGSGKNPRKRGTETDSEGNKNIPLKKPFKKSYATVAKEGSKMCEIRRASGGSMEQVDYDRVIVKLMYALMAFQKGKPVKDRDTWSIRGSGLSRSAVWIGVGSDACVDFIRQNIPGILEDPEDRNSPALYVFFGPGERPFRTLRWRVPYMWCRIPLEDLREMLYMCNPELWEQIERSNGVATDPVWTLKKRVYDQRDAKPEDGSGFVTFILEVEEDMMRILIENCLGVLRIGATEGRLTGSGIVAGVRDFLGVGEGEDEGETGDNDDKDDEADEKENENDDSDMNE